MGGAFIFTIIEHALARRPWHSSVTHHDALEFPDGHVVLLTRLCVGQRATVLQLPAAPRTQGEAGKAGGLRAFSFVLMVRAQRRRNFGRPREQIVEEAAAQVENLLFNKPLSDGQNLFQRFNHIWSIHKATAFESLR